MKNKKNLFTKIFSLICMTSLLSSSFSAASYFDEITKGKNDYASIAWKAIKDNPTATLASLAIAGILLYSAKQMAAAKLAAEKQKRTILRSYNDKSSQWQKIENRYRILVDILNRNPAVSLVLSTIDTNNKIMPQLKKMKNTFKQLKSWVTNARTLFAENYEGPYKDLLSCCTLILLHFKLQEDIEALDRLVALFAPIAHTGTQSLSHDINELTDLQNKLKLIDKMIKEYPDYDTELIKAIGNDFKKITDRYRFLINTLNLNQKLPSLLSTIDTNDKIIPQLETINSVIEEGDWLKTLQSYVKKARSVHAKNYEGPYKYLLPCCALVLLHFQLQEDIETLDKLIASFAPVALAAEQFLSYDINELTYLQDQLKLIDKMVTEHSDYQTQAKQAEAKISEAKRLQQQQMITASDMTPER